MKIYILKQLVSYSVKRSATFFKTKQRSVRGQAAGSVMSATVNVFDANGL